MGRAPSIPRLPSDCQSRRTGPHRRAGAFGCFLRVGRPGRCPVVPAREPGDVIHGSVRQLFSSVVITLVETVDTGQGDWSAVSRPATDAVRAMWTSGDPLGMAGSCAHLPTRFGAFTQASAQFRPRRGPPATPAPAAWRRFHYGPAHASAARGGYFGTLAAMQVSGEPGAVRMAPRTRSWASSARPRSRELSPVLLVKTCGYCG